MPLEQKLLTHYFPENAFGDPFDLCCLSLPRNASGYAVQWLGTDTLLDREKGYFLPVRSGDLQGLFTRFDLAHAAASRWVLANCVELDEHQLAIVPAAFDEQLRRHILIYGVLRGEP